MAPRALERRAFARVSWRAAVAHPVQSTPAMDITRPRAILSFFLAATAACTTVGDTDDVELGDSESIGYLPSDPRCPGAPVDPVTLVPLCPPYDRPAVFLVPHPDDETLTMGGAIIQHLDAGRPVFLDLMTRGTATGARATLASGGTDDWHPGTHDYVLSPEQIGTARTREFLDAAARLGVTGVYVSDFGDKDLTAEEVGQRASWWIANGGPGLSLKGTYTGHTDHIAVWDGLRASGHADIRGYSYDDAFRTRVDGIAAQCEDKSFALGAYEVWDPARGRFAVGYHSAAWAFTKARADCHEYVVVP